MTRAEIEKLLKFDERESHDQAMRNGYDSNYPSQHKAFESGAKSEHARLCPLILRLLDSRHELRAALEYYAKHESVIAEAYHSNDERQITCVHTFINHKAVDALQADDARWAGQ